MKSIGIAIFLSIITHSIFGQRKVPLNDYRVEYGDTLYMIEISEIYVIFENEYKQTLFELKDSLSDGLYSVYSNIYTPKTIRTLNFSFEQYSLKDSSILLVRAKYKNGKRDNSYIEYNTDGNPKLNWYYVSGDLIWGKEYNYYSNGKLKTEFSFDTSTTEIETNWYEDGTPMDVKYSSLKRPDKKNKLETSTTCLDSATFYFPNGEIEHQEYWFNCKKNGNWKYYSKSGHFITKKYLNDVLKE